MPEADRTHYEVPGLHSPAEIVVDRWGIPHIRAASEHDLYFVQGFQAARDRLWQLDIWRKRGLGRLARDFGPGFLAQDRAARLFLYRGDMAAEWAAYGRPDVQAITVAFVAGINAWIALTETRPELLAPEFAAMDTRPERWLAEDVVRVRSHGRVRNVLSEVARAQIVARAGHDTDLVRRSIEPPLPPSIPEGLDPACIPADVLDVFKLATAEIDFSPERLAAGLEDAWRWIKVSDLGDVTAEGSNNWAVSGARTETGRPILASDPHRAHSLPSLRSLVHLTAPGIDVIGAGEPALPGVSLGHNGKAAFGLTIFPMDQEDLYVYETRPGDPDLYRYGEGWERMRVECEQIEVRGAQAQDIVLKFTRHGPVVQQDGAANRSFAVRTVWSEPGSSPYLASLGYMGAGSPAQFAKALPFWSSPSVNHVYADTDGNIAWFVAGASPIRPNWDGLMPVPGDGRYEWAGFQHFEDLPKAVNPPRGFVATANEMNLPDDYPYRQRKLGFEWAERSRTNRIHEVLDAQNPHTLEQSMQLQTDDLSIPARRLRPLLDRLRGEGDAARALDLLRNWDFHLHRDSAAAALQEVWWSKHLKPALLDGVTTDSAVRALLAPGDVETLLGMLEQEDCVPDRDALLLRTLAAAFADCRARLGDDPAGWKWGSLHHGYFEHWLSPVRPGMRDVGRLPKGGSGSTLMAATYRMSDFRITSGASFRMVVDVGNWDNSRAINAPGESGDPGSPHYDDLAPLWAAGEYVPLLYSKEAVDAAAELRITLTPGLSRSAPMLTLTAGEASLVLAPEIGGSVFNWTRAEHHIFRPTLPGALAHDSARTLASYPLFPFSNRVANRSFSFGGETFELPDLLNGFAIHGAGWQVPWDFERDGDAAATLSLEYGPGPLWPFAFHAEQRFSLSPDALVADLTITNRDARPMPAGFGLHPYFPRSPDATLQFHADGVWRSGPNSMPKERIAAPPEWDHEQPRLVGSATLDNCFTGFGGHARLAYADRGYAVEITASPIFGHLVVYVPEGQPFLAVEPVSNMNDGFNRMGTGVDTGVFVLQPGEFRNGQIAFRLSDIA